MGVFMTAWRDSVSDQAQAELDSLLDSCLHFALHLLAKYGEFYPFSRVVPMTGEVASLALTMDEEQPASQVVIEGLINALRDERDGFRAVALVTDERITELGSDAIRVALEHREGVWLAVVLPYSLAGPGLPPVTGELVATEGVPFVWAPEPYQSSV
jgi:hypothetical protein